MNKKVSIILLNYNGYNDTIEAVESLEKIKYNNYEIIIVDNESTNDSYEILKSKLNKKHTLIKSGKNGGFAYGNNVGIKHALEGGAEYILLINNDTEVEPEFLNYLVESLEEDEKVGLSTGLILNYYNKEKVWYAGGEINWDKFYGYHIDEGKNIKHIIMKEKFITFATGCLMLIKSSVLKEIGFLPEEYFMYYEDVDFCAKLQKSGYSIRYNPKSIIYHKISAASGEEESPFAVEWNTRNRLRFMKKYKSKVSKTKYYKSLIYFYVTRIIKIINYLLKRRRDKIRALIKGLSKNALEN